MIPLHYLPPVSAEVVGGSATLNEVHISIGQEALNRKQSIKPAGLLSQCFTEQQSHAGLFTLTTLRAGQRVDVEAEYCNMRPTND